MLAERFRIIDDVSLQVVVSVRNFGVIIDAELNFNVHTKATNGRANRLLGISIRPLQYTFSY